jgi:hypothetical protein
MYDVGCRTTFSVTGSDVTGTPTSSGGPSPTSSITSSASRQVLDLICLLVLILLFVVTITS